MARCRSTTAETSTHLDDAFRLSHRGAAAKRARSVGAPWRLSVANVKHLQVQVRGPSSKHSPPECQRQRRARTLMPPSTARTVEQPQSLLDQSELHGGSPLQRQRTILQVQVRGLGGKHSPSEF